MRIACNLIAVSLALGGVAILGRCLELSVAFGGLDYGDFNQYAWVGRSDGKPEFADWPTGERPAYSYIPSWWIGFGCLALAGAFTWCSMSKHDDAHAAYTSVEPTTDAVSIRTVVDSSFTFAVSLARLPGLWLTSIR